MDESPHTVQRMFAASMKTTTRYGPVLRVEEEASPTPFGAGFYCAADGRYYYTAKAENLDPDDYDLFSAVVQLSHDTLHLSHVERVPQVNQTTFFDGQPALTPDGLILYFTSDRPGGVGGTDLWYSTRPNIASQAWSEPKDVGPPVNTPCDEITPMIAPDGKTLYFSSNGHATVGGYDLFKSTSASIVEKGAVGWSEPENLGEPINTKYDEVFPYALNDTAFFFVSNQPAPLKGRNIYALTRTYLSLKMGDRVSADTLESSARVQDSVMATLKSQPVRVIGTVDQGQRRDSTDLFVQDPETHTELASKKLVPSGNFELFLNRGKQYDVGVRNESSFYDIKRLDFRHTNDTLVYVHLSLPDTLVLHINFPFDDYTNPYEFIIGDSGEQLNVTWEHSLDLVAQSVEASKGHLKQLLLLGHTDSLGTDAYNTQLGQRRAEFVRAELIKRGVPSAIIRIESRGRTEPVGKRSKESDEIFRLRSRRVEFVKVFKK